MSDTPQCELCAGTGWYGDRGPGRGGNAESVLCEKCRPNAENPIKRLERELAAANELSNERLAWLNAYRGELRQIMKPVDFRRMEQECRL